MLKTLSMYWLGSEGIISDDKAEEIYSNKNNLPYKSLRESEHILFKAEDQKKLEASLEIKFDHSNSCSNSCEDISKYLDGYDGRDYAEIKVNGEVQIGMDECISYLKEHIADYENRIFNADDPSEEISRILDSILVMILHEKEKEFKDQVSKIESLVKANKFEWQ